MKQQRVRAAVVVAAWLVGALVAGGGVSTAVAAEAQGDPYDQSDVAIEADAPDKAMTKIVLVSDARTPSKKPGGHEYFAGLALLGDQLRQTPGVWPVMVRDGWPKDESIFDGAKSVVFYSDGGGKQGFLKSDDRIARVQKLVDAGAGIVILHGAVHFPKNYAEQGMAWMGGAWLNGYSDRARGHWDSAHEKFPTHAVTRGVTPWKLNDGWLARIKFVDDAARITPLVWSGKKHLGSPEGGVEDVTGLVYERPNGGRSFGFTGLDAHFAWGLDGMRQFVVNGVLWSAGVDIPETGAKCELDTATMNRHFDPLPAKK